MQKEDGEALDRLLETLEEEGFLFPECRLKRDDTGDLCLLGQGANGIVYEMQDTKGKSYALKVIGLGNRIIDPDKYYDWMGTYQNLFHDCEYMIHIIDAREFLLVFSDSEKLSVRDAGSLCDEKEGIILQFVLMEKLEVVLAKEGKNASLRRNLQSEKEVINFALQIGKALYVMHSGNYVHGDVKLENMYFDKKKGCYKLGDFNSMERAGKTVDVFAYTDGYVAPEIKKRKTTQYERTADIYSFGVCLFLLLNNLHFPSSSGYIVNRLQYADNYSFPNPRNASDKMTHIIQKMCRYNKNDRYQSMEEVMDAIQKVMQEMKEESILIFVESSDGMEFSIWIPKMNRPA